MIEKHEKPIIELAARWMLANWEKFCTCDRGDDQSGFFGGHRSECDAPWIATAMNKIIAQCKK